MSSREMLPSTFLYAGALALAALAALISAPAADAAFPGENGRIAYHDFVPDASAEIHTINPDGSDIQQLTPTDELDDLEPAWSPDGTRIVFYRVVPHEFGPTTAEIWVMNADGSNRVQLTTGSFGEEDDPSFDSEPAFSGDGTQVVFTRRPVGDVGDGDSEIWLMNADGTGQTQVTDNFVTDIEPTINPASTLIAWSQEFVGDVLAAQAGSGREMQQIDMDIVTSDLSGGNFRIVTDVSPDDEAPNFSPDGSTIAFARCVLDEDEQGFPICEDAADIFSVPTTGDEDDVTQLTGGGEEDFEIDEDPAYSPDGTQMVFSRFTIEPPSLSAANQVEPRTPASGDELQLAASSGGASTDLTVGYNGDWQPVQPAGTPGTPGTSGPAGTADLGTCRGHAVTIAGTPASETIVGTSGDDVIKGRKGNDRIKGLDGDDYICGQRGRDKLFGNVGDDTLIGGQSRDFLKGGPGIDTLFGGTPGAPDDPVPNICAPDPGDQTKNCKVG